jgi:hypothetical protein
MFLAVATLPHILKAEDAPKPPHPNPETMFGRLDANKDGVITADELPAGMPERMKQFLIKADKNGDQKLSLDELKEAFKERQEANRPAERPEGHPGPRPEGQPGHRPEGRPEMGPPLGFGGFGGPGMGMQHRGGWWGGQDGMGPPHRPEGWPGPEQNAMRPMPARGEGHPGMGLGQLSMRTLRASLPEMPNLNVVFNRLDTDKDGKLSFEEFKSGVEKLHRLMAVQQAGKSAPVYGFAGRTGRYDDRPPQPWMAMRQTGWEADGYHGLQFQGRGMGPWMGHSQQQYQNPWMRAGPHSQGPWMARSSQFYGHGMGPRMGPGPLFSSHHWAGQFPGHQPQFAGHGYGQFDQEGKHHHHGQAGMSGRHHDGDRGDVKKSEKKHHHDDGEKKYDKQPPSEKKPEKHQAD